MALVRGAPVVQVTMRMLGVQVARLDIVAAEVQDMRVAVVEPGNGVEVRHRQLLGRLRSGTRLSARGQCRARDGARP
jgi:hypothetical protein